MNLFLLLSLSTYCFKEKKIHSIHLRYQEPMFHFQCKQFNKCFCATKYNFYIVFLLFFRAQILKLVFMLFFNSQLICFACHVKKKHKIRIRPSRDLKKFANIKKSSQKHSKAAYILKIIILFFILKNYV